MMQVGMFAIALHAGDLQGMASEYRDLMRWVSVLFTSVVVLYSARGFFETAWKHMLQRTLVMDLPVAIAIGLAFSASVWATASGSLQIKAMSAPAASVIRTRSGIPPITSVAAILKSSEKITPENPSLRRNSVFIQYGDRLAIRRSILG